MFNKLSKILKIHKFAANATLIDGTEILIDGQFDTGALVYVVTSDGDKPLPDGEYTLGDPYDGYIIIVTEGAITDITEPVEDEGEPEPDPAETEAGEEEETQPEDTVSFEDQFIALQEIVNSLIERIETLEGVSGDLSTQNDELSKQNADLLKSNEDFSKQIIDFTDKLEKLNGVEPLKKKGDLDNFSKSNKSYNRVLEELGRNKK